MHALVRAVFSRLHTLDPVLEEEKLQTNNEEEPQDGDLKMTVSPVHVSGDGKPPELNQMDDPVQQDSHKASSPQGETATSVRRPQCNVVSFLWSYVSESTVLDGLPSILELLRVLINVLDPTDQQHTDSTRLIALGILGGAFEVAGPRIADFPSLEALVLDSGCKFLFQLARSENTSILHLALRTISTVFETLRRHLKLQQELFLAFTIDRLAPPTPNKVYLAPTTLSGKKGSASPRPGTPVPAALGTPDPDADSDKGSATPPRLLVLPARGETRDVMLETLSQIASHPSFMVDLYTNYDCDINCENLFERLIEFLTKVRVILCCRCEINSSFAGCLPLVHRRRTRVSTT